MSCSADSPERPALLRREIRGLDLGEKRGEMWGGLGREEGRETAVRLQCMREKIDKNNVKKTKTKIKTREKH